MINNNVRAFHFLGFVMHQPEGNLIELLNNVREAYQVRQILLAYQRPVEYAELYADVARFCVCFSGVLLEQLQNPELIERVGHYIDLPRMLERYAAATNIELAGTGYYHPLFPLIPESHWAEQIVRGRDKVTEVFGRPPQVFWPPEMGLSCHMIPELVDAGYRYVTVDGVHVRPSVPLTPSETFYRAHLAEQAGKQIILIPRDGQLSEAQMSGTNPDYMRQEVMRNTGQLSQPALVTTWTDGENGNVFRNEDANFWGEFFAPYMERVRHGEAILIPTTLPVFFARYPVDHSAMAVAGTWTYDRANPQDTSFEMWAASQEQQALRDELRAVAESLQNMPGSTEPSRDTALARALELLLRAEASDNFYGKNVGWLGRSRRLLEEAKAMMEAG